MLSSRVVIIAVTGRSGSGKTTVADNIVKHFGEENAVKLPTDRYYFGRPENQTREEFNANTDFDHPNSLNWKQLVDDLEQLAAGNDVYVPNYSFKTSESKPNADLVRAKSIIVVEGIFALHDPDVRKRIGITVFVHAPGDGKPSLN